MSRPPKPSRSRRILKRLGLGACLLIAAAWAISTQWRVVLRISSRDFVGLCTGGVLVGHRSAVSPSPWPTRRLGLSPAKDYPYIRLPGGWRVTGPNAGWIRWCPLWLLLGASAMPTALLWWRDRRARLPGACRQCGYNLTGNVTGICPECGREIT